MPKFNQNRCDVFSYSAHLFASSLSVQFRVVTSSNGHAVTQKKSNMSSNSALSVNVRGQLHLCLFLFPTRSPFPHSNLQKQLFQTHRVQLRLYKTSAFRKALRGVNISSVMQQILPHFLLSRSQSCSNILFSATFPA